MQPSRSGIRAGKAATRGKGVASRPYHGPERRRFTRWTRSEPAVLIIGNERLPCTVLDFSASGVRVSGEHPLRPGAALLIELTGLSPIKALVIRTEADSMGLEFREALHYRFE